MAVVSVNEDQSRSTGVRSTTGREYTRCWIIQLNEHTDGVAVALNAGDLPDLWTTHPDDAGATLWKLTPAIMDAKDDLQWLVYGHYRTPQTTDIEPDPLDDPVIPDWGSWAYTEPLVKDRSGTSILNSAGYPFDPPAEIERHGPLVTIVRNEATYNPATSDSYRDSVNSDSTTIAGLAVTARQAMCLEYSGHGAIRNEIAYFVVTYQIAFKSGTWDRALLNTGFNIATGERVKEIVSTAFTTNDSQVPMLLAANGTQLAYNGTETYQTYEANALKTFATLGLNI